MYEQNNRIRVLFTKQANSALDSIIKKYGLEDSPEKFSEKNNTGGCSNLVTIDHFSKKFLLGEISENDLMASLQKNLGTDQKTSKQICKEIIDNIIPFLVKAPEENFKDPEFVKKITEEVFGEQPTQTKSTPQKMDIEDKNLFPDIQPQKNTPVQKTPVFSPQPKTKKSIPVIKNDLPTKQPKGPDKYREPIQ